jgi:hypothetical protein
MKKRQDLTGQKFGRLTVISFSHKTAGKNSCWHCLCDCGGKAIVRTGSLKDGKSKSCGCIREDVSRARENRQVLHGSSAYDIWLNMKARCYNKNANNYKYYGGRGITICNRWLNSFDFFIADMGVRPSTNHSIDRINNGGNYEPDNCRWAAKKEQMRNRRSNVWINVEGAVKTIAEWSEITNQKYITVLSRLRRGWPEYNAVMGFH